MMTLNLRNEICLGERFNEIKHLSLIKSEFYFLVALHAFEPVILLYSFSIGLDMRSYRQRRNNLRAEIVSLESRVIGLHRCIDGLASVFGCSDVISDKGMSVDCAVVSAAIFGTPCYIDPQSREILLWGKAGFALSRDANNSTICCHDRRALGGGNEGNGMGIIAHSANRPSQLRQRQGNQLRKNALANVSCCKCSYLGGIC